MFTAVCFLLGFLILTLAGGSQEFELFVLLVIVLVSAGYLLDLALNKKLQIVKYPLLTGYFARLLLLFYDVYSDDPFHLPLVGGIMTSDPLRFFNAATSIAMGNTANYGGAFSRLFGIIFRFTSPSRLWGEYIVMLFSILTLYTIARIVVDLEVSDTDKKASMYFACLMPNYMLLSVIFRRETIITFFLALSLLFFLKWTKGGNSEKPFVFSIVFALLASLFHGATGLIAVFYLMVHFIYRPGEKRFTLTTKNIVLVLGFSMLFVIFYARYGTVYFTKLERLNGNIESLSSVRDVGGASYARYVGNSKSIANILIYSIPRYAYFMYSPFPWQWRGLADILTFFMSSVPYLIILLRTIRSIRVNTKDGQLRTLLLILLFFTVGMTFVFSWGVTNTGTATRHRDKFIALYMIMFAYSRKNRIRLKLRN